MTNSTLAAGAPLTAPPDLPPRPRSPVCSSAAAGSPPASRTSTGGVIGVVLPEVSKTEPTGVTPLALAAGPLLLAYAGRMAGFPPPGTPRQVTAGAISVFTALSLFWAANRFAFTLGLSRSYDEISDKSAAYMVVLDTKESLEDLIDEEVHRVIDPLLDVVPGLRVPVDGMRVTHELVERLAQETHVSINQPTPAANTAGSGSMTTPISDNPVATAFPPAPSQPPCVIPSTQAARGLEDPSTLVAFRAALRADHARPGDVGAVAHNRACRNRMPHQRAISEECRCMGFTCSGSVHTVARWSHRARGHR